MNNNHSWPARVCAVGYALTFATVILMGCRDQNGTSVPPIPQSQEAVVTAMTLSPMPILSTAAPLHSPVLTVVPAMPTQASTISEGKLAALVERNPAYGIFTDLYLVDSQMGEITRLTSDMNVDSLSWSPDGRQIAFSALAPEYSSYEVFVVDTASRGIRHLEIPLVGGANRDEVSWSPLGDRLAFVQRAAADDGRIYTMKVNGTDIQYLTEGNRPSWSPDGKYITFVRPRRPGTYGDIFIVDPEGKNPKQLTYDIEADGPSWSPDGNHIAFAGFWLGRDDPATGYYIMNADGTDLTFLSGRGDSFPSWSQDGQRILFTERGHVYSIEIGNLDVVPVEGLAPDLYYVFVRPQP